MNYQQVAVERGAIQSKLNEAQNRRRRLAKAKAAGVNVTYNLKETDAEIASLTAQRNKLTEQIAGSLPYGGTWFDPVSRTEIRSTSKGAVQAEPVKTAPSVAPSAPIKTPKGYVRKYHGKQGHR